MPFIIEIVLIVVFCAFAWEIFARNSSEAYKTWLIRLAILTLLVWAAAHGVPTDVMSAAKHMIGK